MTILSAEIYRFIQYGPCNLMNQMKIVDGKKWQLGRSEKSRSRSWYLVLFTYICDIQDNTLAIALIISPFFLDCEPNNIFYHYRYLFLSHVAVNQGALNFDTKGRKVYVRNG